MGYFELLLADLGPHMRRQRYYFRELIDSSWVSEIKQYYFTFCISSTEVHFEL